MNGLSISISQLKTNPAAAIARASDYPLTIKSRNKVKAHLIGHELFEKILAYLEDYIDKKAVQKTDFKKGKDFETVARQLNI